EATARVRELAVATFEALGCEGLARVDFFYTPTGEVVVNELNTMPGFTPFSMYPMMWERSGMPYTDLITELVELARERPTGLRRCQTRARSASMRDTAAPRSTSVVVASSPAQATGTVPAIAGSRP